MSIWDEFGKPTDRERELYRRIASLRLDKEMLKIENDELRETLWRNKIEAVVINLEEHRERSAKGGRNSRRKEKPFKRAARKLAEHYDINHWQEIVIFLSNSGLLDDLEHQDVFLPIEVLRVDHDKKEVHFIDDKGKEDMVTFERVRKIWYDIRER